MNPTLYLIPSPLGEEFHPDAFPNEIKSIIEKLDYFIVENEKEVRRFIKKSLPIKTNPPSNFTPSTNTPLPMKWQAIWIPV